MTLFLASILFSVIVLIYWIILELFTMMFRTTGLPDDKARFARARAFFLQKCVEGLLR